jgi:hypothetical protein
VVESSALLIPKRRILCVPHSLSALLNYLQHCNLGTPRHSPA